MAVWAWMPFDAHALLVKSYDFNGDYTDTLGIGDPLTDSGGTVLSNRYRFYFFLPYLH